MRVGFSGIRACSPSVLELRHLFQDVVIRLARDSCVLRTALAVWIMAEGAGAPLLPVSCQAPRSPAFEGDQAGKPVRGAVAVADLCDQKENGLPGRRLRAPSSGTGTAAGAGVGTPADGSARLESKPYAQGGWRTCILLLLWRLRPNCGHAQHRKCQGPDAISHKILSPPIEFHTHDFLLNITDWNTTPTSETSPLIGTGRTLRAFDSLRAKKARRRCQLEANFLNDCDFDRQPS